MDTTSPLLWLIILLALLGPLTLVYARSDLHRQRLFRQVARRLSFEYRPSGRGLDREWFNRFPLFCQGGNHTIRHVLKGTFRGYDALVFDYHGASGGAMTVVAFQLHKNRVPYFTLWPRQPLPLNHWEPGHAGEEVAVEPPHPEFAAHYALHSPHPTAMRDLFGGKLLRFFARHGHWAIEAGGDWIVFYRPDAPHPTRLYPYIWQAFQMFRPFSLR